MNISSTPDYLAIGHLTIDLDPQGRQRLGGTVLYSALLAARSGLHTAILTRGNFHKADESVQRDLQVLAESVEIIMQDSDEPTSFTNINVAGRRQQTLHSWAGPIETNALPPHWRSPGVLHLAPVAQEVNVREIGRLSPEYIGLTPQGLMRLWPSESSGRVRLTHLRLPREVVGRVDAMVLNAEEHTLAREPIETIQQRGIVAITRGSQGSEIIDRGRAFSISAPKVRQVDDTGAGDVYAAALFCARARGDATPIAGNQAAAASSLLVQRGGIDGIPTGDEIRELADLMLSRA